MSDTIMINSSSELHRKQYEHLMEDIREKKSKSFVLPLMSDENESGVIKDITKKPNGGLTKRISVSSRGGARLLHGGSSTKGKGEKENFYKEEIGSLQLSLAKTFEDEFVNASLGNIAETMSTPEGLIKSTMADPTLNTDYVNTVDQWAIDIFQGTNMYITHTENSVKIPQTPTHIYTVLTANLNSFIDLKDSLNTGLGFKVENDRSKGTYIDIKKPRKPFIKPSDIIKQVDSSYVLYLPTTVVTELKKNTAFNETMRVGDTRGAYNRAINGFVGVIHGIEIRELPLAQGYVDSTANNWTCLDMEVVSPGLRLRDRAGLWTGQKGHDPRAITLSRGFLVSKSALAYSIDMQPQYYFHNDHQSKEREATMNVWMDMKKIRYSTEIERLPNAVDGIDYGVLTVDFITP